MHYCPLCIIITALLHYVLLLPCNEITAHLKEYGSNNYSLAFPPFHSIHFYFIRNLKSPGGVSNHV